MTGEHDDLRTIRLRAANLSMGIGLLGLLLAFFYLSSPVLPAFILLVLGGVVAIGVYRARDTSMSRWFTVWSLLLTVAGVGAAALIGSLAG
ncbi:hypothetical protein [Actinoplanes friuliensis]|nr:hypothetical protein [Actinoplanes friuliensis]